MSSVVRSIATAVMPVALLAAAGFAQAPSRATLIQRIDSIAGAPVKSGAVAGMAVAVVKGRDTLLFKGYGFSDLENQVAVTPQTVFRIGSVTKQFTSSAVMQLVEQGKIGLDDDMTKYIAFPTHGRKILVRHLLNHTSGIPSYTDVGPIFGKIARQDLTRDSLIAIVAPDSLMFEPGTHFYYNNTGYFMLGMILERVTGKKYGDYLAERLFTPNGLTGTTFCDTRKLIPHRAQGYDRTPAGFVNSDYLSMELPFAAGSLCSTVGDLVSWTQKLSSGAIVSPASYRTMTTPVKLPTGRPMNYGFGLTVDSVGGHVTVSHGGGINGFISSLMHVPQDSLVIAVLSNTSPAPSDAVAAAIMRAVLDIPPFTFAIQKEVALSADDRGRYVGTYLLTRPDGTRNVVRIIEESGQLKYQPDGQSALQMNNQGPNIFVAVGAGRVVFDVVNGKAVGFQFGGGARTLEAVRQP